jgi:transcriptional regulator with XRE-family HTH domain
MWLDNLKELKKSKGLTAKQIAELSHLPERTVNRILSGDTDNPYVDTLHRIVTALDGNLNDIFADTKVVVATESLVEVKENAGVVEAERDLISAERDRILLENERLKTENEMLKMQLKHKEELLALHNYYNKLIPNN